MKRKLHRIVAFGAAAVLTVSAAAMLAGCTSSNPEVTITYSFNGNTYEVEYKLSRSDAPQTTQHFIDLADAGYYDGTCIHNYTSTAMYGGGYTFEDGELKEKDYFAEVTKLEVTPSASPSTMSRTAKRPLCTPSTGNSRRTTS